VLEPPKGVPCRSNCPSWLYSQAVDSVPAKLAVIERRRLRSLVEVGLDDMDALHAEDFELIHPSGGVWSKRDYLGGISSGEIDYRQFEAVSAIEVLADGALAVLRYRSIITISVDRGAPTTLDCWHVDCYQQSSTDGAWRARWSQATSIE
jgi:hypothetical protein